MNSSMTQSEYEAALKELWELWNEEELNQTRFEELADSIVEYEERYFSLMEAD